MNNLALPFGRVGHHSRQLLHINVQRLRGGLVLEAQRLCVSTLGFRAMQKEERDVGNYLRLVVGVDGIDRGTSLIETEPPPRPP